MLWRTLKVSDVARIAAPAHGRASDGLGRGVHPVLHADPRLRSSGDWIDPRCLLPLLAVAWRVLAGGLAAPSSGHLGEDGSGPLREFGPFGGTDPIAARSEYPVGNGDLAAGQISWLGPSDPGGDVAVDPVDGGFDPEGVVAPNGPACSCLRRRPDSADQVIRWVDGERDDPVGKRAVQCGVDLSQGGVELLDVRGDVGDLLQTALLVLGEGCETLPKIALGRGRLLHPPFAGGDPRLGVGERLTVEAAPAPAGGVVEPVPAVQQQRFRILALSDGPA